jgi:peroxiredoxin family protein
MTSYMNHKMEQLDIPSIPEFIEMIADTGAGLYACKASADLFGITQADLIDQVKDIITAGEFYDMAAGGEIIFT